MCSLTACVAQLESPGGGTEDEGRSGERPAPGQAGGSEGDLSGNPGLVPVHRLNNAEYDNTVRDLLGAEANIAKTSFVADEELYGFDSIAAALRISDVRYEQYFVTAELLVDQAFKDAAVRDRILSCALGGNEGDACAKGIIKGFGLRAWRRPLVEEEVDRLLRVYSDALEAGEERQAAMGLVLKVMLASPPFLYRFPAVIPGPREDVAQLDAYSLASKLSYALWATMPDDELFAAADDGSLLEKDGVLRQFNRMIGSPRAHGLITGFAAQWLGTRKLAGHQVETTAYPSWDENLRKAMIEEANAYISNFIEAQPLTSFFSSDINFVNERLATHYGFSGNFPKEGLTRTEQREDRRRGFLGLAGFLTLTSFSYRTAPTIRGTWILENLLCEHIPLPPPMIDELDTNMQTEQVQSQNVRERLAEHSRNPACASCHSILDPFGFGLEAFDAIGRHRETYANGDRVDATGTLPDGTRFDGLLELSKLLEDDEPFLPFLDLATKLDAVDMGGHTLLGDTLIAWCQESGASTHDPVNMPVITAGAAAGAMKTGLLVDCRNTTPKAEYPYVDDHPTVSRMPAANQTRMASATRDNTNRECRVSIRRQCHA